MHDPVVIGREFHTLMENILLVLLGLSFNFSAIKLQGSFSSQRIAKVE
jgi:hypothetical protein